MDAQDFAMLVPPHLAAAIYTAAALIGKADAEDAVQEAVMRAWQAWPAMRERAAVRAWFLRITVNVCHDWRRGRFGTHLRLDEPLDEPALALPALLPAGGDPGAQVDDLDLRLAVDALDDALRQVVALRFYADLDATEIGAILGIPAPTVRSRLRRALALLRDALAEEHDRELRRERSL